MFEKFLFCYIVLLKTFHILMLFIAVMLLRLRTLIFSRLYNLKINSQKQDVKEK